jgi:hypothetical protein
MSKKVTTKTVINILKKSLEDKDNVNYSTALEAIVASTSDEAMELILDMLSSSEVYEPIQKSDYVTVPISNYHTRNYCNYDTLKEMGLICPDTDRVYAKVIDDASWGSDYNPYHGMLKVSFLYHDDAKKLHYHEDSVHTIDVKKVNKNSIAYFKNLNHGKDKQTSTKNGNKKLELSEKNVL